MLAKGRLWVTKWEGLVIKKYIHEVGDRRVMTNGRDGMRPILNEPEINDFPSSGIASLAYHLCQY